MFRRVGIVLTPVVVVVGTVGFVWLLARIPMQSGEAARTLVLTVAVSAAVVGSVPVVRARRRATTRAASTPGSSSGEERQRRWLRLATALLSCLVPLAFVAAGIITGRTAWFSVGFVLIAGAAVVTAIVGMVAIAGAWRGHA